MKKKLFLKNIHNFSSLDMDLLHILSHVIYLLKVEHTNFPAIDIYDILIFWNLIKKTASNGKSTGWKYSFFIRKREKEKKKRLTDFILSVYIFSILDPAFAEYICNIYINTLTRSSGRWQSLHVLSLYSDFSSSLYPTLYPIPIGIQSDIT